MRSTGRGAAIWPLGSLGGCGIGTMGGREGCRTSWLTSGDSAAHTLHRSASAELLFLHPAPTQRQFGSAGWSASLTRRAEEGEEASAIESAPRALGATATASSDAGGNTGVLSSGWTALDRFGFCFPLFAAVRLGGGRAKDGGSMMDEGEEPKEAAARGGLRAGREAKLSPANSRCGCFFCVAAGLVPGEEIDGNDREL